MYRDDRAAHLNLSARHSRFSTTVPQRSLGHPVEMCHADMTSHLDYGAPLLWIQTSEFDVRVQGRHSVREDCGFLGCCAVSPLSKGLHSGEAVSRTDWQSASAGSFGHSARKSVVDKYLLAGVAKGWSGRTLVDKWSIQLLPPAAHLLQRTAPLVERRSYCRDPRVLQRRPQDHVRRAATME
jgi:hypothetical protein